jgi:hypothetical protein
MEFKPRCTVESASDIHAALMQALEAGEALTLDFSAVREIDLTFFQLLTAAQRSFERARIPLQFTATLPPELADKARLAGFDFLVATPGLPGEEM